MTDVNVAKVIRSISGAVKPVVPLRSVRTRAWRWAGISAVCLAGALWVFGTRQDMAAAALGAALELQALLLVATAAVAAVAALRLSVPGAARISHRIAPLVMLAVWPVALLGWHLLTGGTPSSLTTEPPHWVCAQTIGMIAIGPAVALAFMVLAGAPAQPAWAMAMAGVAAASVGATGVSLICPVSRLPHVLTAHALPAVIVALFVCAAASSVARLRAAKSILVLVAVLMWASVASAQVAAGDTPAAQLPEFRVSSSVGGYLPSDALLQFLNDAETGAPQHTLLQGRGPLLIGGAILVGGLLLNLTPCVLPMIPINLAIIGAGNRATSRRRGWILGGAYGAAMAVVYGVLGGMIVVTTGTFGVLNSSPWFNAAIAALFLVLGLAMFDVVTVDLSRWSGRIKVTAESRGSVALAFFMGGVAALMAGACVAPVVIQVVALSSQLYSGGSRLALALPFVLGVGMGLPWPFAGAGLAALPKPGKWMVRVKQGLGASIFIAAAYYGYQAVDLTRSHPAVTGTDTNGWYQSLDEGLAAATRENKPIFLDVWATWCKNCVVMDATTFRDPDVRDALDQYVKVRFQAEDLERPDVAALLDRLDSIGLPTYAVLRPAAVDRPAKAPF